MEEKLSCFVPYEADHSFETCDTKSLRALIDKVSSSVRALEALGVPLETYRALLAPMVRQKIPEQLNLRLSRKLADSVDGDEFININVIRQFLESELIARENVELTSMSQQEGSSGSASRSSKDGNWKSNGNFKSNHKGKSGYKKEKAIGHALVADCLPPATSVSGSTMLINA